MSSFDRIEEIYKNGFDATIAAWMDWAGQDFNLHRVVVDDHVEVFGPDAEADEEITATFTGILVTYEMTPVDTLSAGTFVEGFLFTDSLIVSEGDTIEPIRSDGRTRRYKVLNEDMAGMVSDAYKRFKCVSVND